MRYFVLLGILSVQAAALPAQSLTDRVREVRDGDVRMSFAAREGVCGDGRGSISVGRHVTVSEGSHDWESVCEAGPVRVRLTKRDGAVVAVRTYVGGRWAPGGDEVTDLGTVSAREAAAFLLAVAERSDARGGDAIFPATLADGVEVWPSLLRLARSGDLPRETRRAAVTYLGYAAGDAVAGELGQIAEREDEDESVRKAALYAVSQRPADESIPILARVVRSNRSPAMRKTAIYYLSQSDDPRAIAVFEEILSRR